MSNIPVYWYSLHPDVLARGQWDDAFLGDLLDDDRFEHLETTELRGGFGIVIIHARLHDKDIKRINKDLLKLKSCIVILVGDEQNVFPFEDLEHPRMRTYVMHPRPGRHDSADRFLINGYAPDTKMLKDYKNLYLEKPLDYFFAGQLGHAKREECVAALRVIPNGEVVTTKGFTQGLDHDQYFLGLAKAKIAPCPSGPAMPDTFRLYEALEAGCIPIVDTGPEGYPGGFWVNLFGEIPPFPILSDWGSAKETIEIILADWEVQSSRVFGWWQSYKRRVAIELEVDIFQLTGQVRPQDITAMIPSSPSPVHPSTDMINETIGSIRERLPDSEIIVQLDGVRQEQENRRAEYQAYIRRFLWECNWEHQNVLPVVFKDYQHQSGKAKATIDMVKTPYLLFVEHDVPLFDQIPFDKLAEEDLAGMNLIRFSHEASVLKPHEHLMVDEDPVVIRGIPLIRTVMWSSRPFICRTTFFRWILSEYFGQKSKTFIEWVMYGVQLHAWETEGYYGWEKFRTAIFAEQGQDGIRRSANLDGRKSDPILSGDFLYDGDTPPGAPEPGERVN